MRSLIFSSDHYSQMWKAFTEDVEEIVCVFSTDCLNFRQNKPTVGVHRTYAEKFACRRTASAASSTEIPEIWLPGVWLCVVNSVLLFRERSTCARFRRKRKNTNSVSVPFFTPSNVIDKLKHAFNEHEHDRTRCRLIAIRN